MKAKMANCGASVKPNRKARMYGGGMPMKKKKKSMSYNMGGMPMKMKKKEDMGMARGNMGIKNR
mgnify:CR=1 FL=1|tara:strand:- start:268 stop:459 length:192 start_codon:yes stop_codon:yes gene_type:complete